MPTKPKQRSDVGERLKALRRSRKVTAAQLSKDLGEQGTEFSRQAIANVENGLRADVSLTEAVAISEYFEVPLEELTGRAQSSPVALIVAHELARALLDVEQLKARLADELPVREGDAPAMSDAPSNHASQLAESSVRDFIKFWNAVMASLATHASDLSFDQRNVIASQAWFELHPDERPADGMPSDAVIFDRSQS